MIKLANRSNRSNKASTRQAGFSMIELMLTIAIMGILVGLGAPSFNNAMRNQRIKSATYELMGDMNFARAEASRGGQRIYVGSINNASLDWASTGRVVWRDADSDSTYDAGEEVRVASAANNGTTVTTTAPRVVFYSTGEASAALTFSVCDSVRTGELGKEVTLLTSGVLVITNEYLTCS